MSSTAHPVLGTSHHLAHQDPSRRLPGETSIQAEAGDLFENPEAWLNAANPMLGGKSPRDCIGQPDEQAVWDLLRTIRRVGQT